MQGGVKQRGVQHKARGIGVGALGQLDLGVDVCALAPGRAEALEDGAVVKADLGQALIEVRDL